LTLKTERIVEVNQATDILKVEGSLYVITLDHNNNFVLALCDPNGNPVDE